MTDIFITILLTTAAVLAAGAIAMLSFGIVNNLWPFFIEVKEESQGGLVGLSGALIRKLGTMSRRFMWPKYEKTMHRALIQAGEPQGYRPEDIMAMQGICFVIGSVFGFILIHSLDVHWALFLLAGVLGLFYPLIWLRDAVKRRHLAISRMLSFNLDLLTLAVEAGLDFTAALAKVVSQGKAGPLRDELSLVLKQLKMGKTREEALRQMIFRVGMPALSQFVLALIQADKMGTSLGKVLRVQSTQLRIARTQRAEKLASEAPVKMLFPLIAFIFPAVFIILLGPIIFAFMFGA